MSRTVSTKTLFTKERLKGAAGIAGLTAAGLVIATLPGIATSAAWVDSEWVAATQGTEPGIGTGDCEAPTFETQARAAFLGLDGLGIGDLVQLGTLEAVNDGTTSTSTPAVAPVGPPPTQSNQYFNLLDLGVINGDLLELEIDALNLPLNSDLSVLGSYAEAQPNGYSAAGSGLVTNQGALNAEAADDEDLELMGSLSLDDVLDSVLGDGTTDIDDVLGLDLNLGAVGSIASLDACPLMWDGAFDEHLTRDYLIAALGLQVESPLVGLITDELEGLLTLIEDARLDALVDVEATLDPLLGGLLAPVELLADVTVDLDVGVDVSSITDLLTNGVLNGNDIVEIDLGSGIITVDLANLLGNPGTGLNGLPANTELLVDEDVIDDLTDALSAAIADLVTQLGTAVAEVVASVELGGNITAVIDVAGTDVVEVVAPLNGDTVQVNLLSNFCDDPENALLCVGLDATTTTVSGLLSGLVTTITGLVQGTLDALAVTIAGLDDAVIVALELLDDADSLLFALLSDLFEGLFLNGILSIIVNAQSAPTSNELTNPIPPNFENPPVLDGQYDVAAIRIGVLDLLGPDLNVDLTLARSSVGPNVYLGP